MSCLCLRVRAQTPIFSFLEGSFQSDYRTAEVANYPTDGEREWDRVRERGGAHGGERRKERESRGKREKNHVAINSSSCPSGSAELSTVHSFVRVCVCVCLESIGGWQGRNRILFFLFTLYPSIFCISRSFGPSLPRL